MPEILTADNLNSVAGIRHGFFTRAWGDCGLADTSNLFQKLENRSRVAGSLSVKPENLVSAYQIHSALVEVVTEAWFVIPANANGQHEPLTEALRHKIRNRPQVDALVTKQKDI